MDNANVTLCHQGEVNSLCNFANGVSSWTNEIYPQVKLSLYLSRFTLSASASFSESIL